MNLINQHGLIAGLSYRQRNDTDVDLQNRPPALTFHPQKDLLNGARRTGITLSLHDRQFDLIYSKMIGKIAETYNINVGSQLYRDMVTTLPAFKSMHGIVCEEKEVIKRDVVIYHSDKSKVGSLPLKELGLDKVFSAYPSIHWLFNKDRTLLANVRFDNQNLSRVAIISISFRGQKAPFKLTTGFGLASNIEGSYLSACKKLASCIDLASNQSVIRALFATLDNFKTNFNISENHIVEKDILFVTTSAIERRSMQMGISLNNLDL